MKKKLLALIAMIMILALPMTSFATDGEITKAQFLKEVLEAAKVDTADESTLDSFVEEAYTRGLISEDEKLDADEVITKTEAVIILVKAFGEKLKVNDITQKMIDEEVNFTDNDSINPLAKPYITYAIKNDLIEKKDSFYPLMLLTEKTSGDMIAQAKEANQKYFTRQGLTAGEILVKANENLQNLTTYKANGKLKMNMTMDIEGLPEEEELSQGLFDQGMNMDMDMILDCQVENPDKIYIKETIKANIDALDTEELDTEELDAEEIDTETAIEVFMDGEVMYQKMPFSGEEGQWLKNDMSSVLNKVQSLQGNNPQNMAQLSDEQLEFYKNYATYGDDEKIGGKEYYVVNIDIDKESYKKFFKKYVQKIMDAVLEQQKENISTEEDEDAAAVEMTNMIVKQMLDKMDIDMSHKYYINKKTMNYERVWMSQNMYMNMDSLIQMVQAMAEEEDTDTDLSNVKVDMITHTEGTIYYNEFDGKVVFPVIKEKDIFKLEDIMQENQN